MRRFEQGDYVITINNGRARVVPKRAGLKTVSIGINGSVLVLNIEDLKREDGPLIFRRTVPKENVIAPSSLAPEVAEVVGDELPTHESFSSVTMEENEFGMKYQLLNNFSKYSVTGWEIHNSTYEVVKSNLIRNRAGWGTAGYSIVVPKKLSQTKDYARSDIFTSEYGSYFYLNNTSGYRTFEALDTKENSIHISGKARLSDSQALVSALNAELSMIFTKFAPRDVYGNVAEITHAKEKDGAVILFLNNGDSYRISYYQGRGGAIRVNPVTLESKYAPYIYSVGDNGMLAKGINNPPKFDFGVNKNVNQILGGTFYFNSPIGGRVPNSDVPTSWCETRDVNLSNYSWMDNVIDGYKVNTVTICENSAIGNIETDVVRINKTLEFNDSSFVGDIDECFTTNNDIKSNLRNKKIPISTDTRSRLLQSQDHSGQTLSLVKSCYMPNASSYQKMDEDTHDQTGIVLSFEKITKQ